VPTRISIVGRRSGTFDVWNVAAVDAEEVTRRRDLFLEHVAMAFDVGLTVAARESEQGKGAVECAREALFACLHNVFVILDHGTGLDFLVFLVDEDGNELTPGALHEDFVAHLLDTGRYR
jgi:hypothetical protein